jgi:hypothetical protein
MSVRLKTPEVGHFLSWDNTNRRGRLDRRPRW